MIQRIVLTVLAVFFTLWLGLMNKPEVKKQYVAQTYATPEIEIDTVYIRDTVFLKPDCETEIVEKAPDDYSELMTQNKALRDKIWSLEVEIDKSNTEVSARELEISQMDNLITNLVGETVRLEKIESRLGREVIKWESIVNSKDHTIQTLQDLITRLQDEDVEDLSDLVPDVLPRWPIKKNSISAMMMYDGHYIYYGPSYSRNINSSISFSGGFFTEDKLRNFYPFGGLRINF